MFMRIAWGRLKPGHWDAYEAAFAQSQEGVVLDGLKARYLIQDATQPDSGFSISVWESEEAMRAYETDKPLRDKLLGQVQEHFTGDFSVQRCRVRYERHYDER